VASYLTFLMAVIFLTSSVSKFVSPKTFHRTLIQLGIRGRQVRLLGWFIPSIEILTALLLVVPGGQRSGQITMLILLLGFTAVVGKAIIKKTDTDCNCFGSFLPEKLGTSTLIRLIVLIGVTVFLIASEPVELYALPVEQLIFQVLASTGWFAIYILSAQVIRQFKALRAS